PDFGLVPASKWAWHEMSRGTGTKWGPHNPYPSYWSVLSHFASFRQAWRAVGIPTDHCGEQWTSEEYRFLKASVGCLSQKEIAQCLGRTEVAIKKRRIRLGLSPDGTGVQCSRPRHSLDKY